MEQPPALFRLSRRNGKRPNAAKKPASVARASDTAESGGSPPASSQSSPEKCSPHPSATTPVALATATNGKRRRRAPLPSFFDEEIEKAELAFFGADEQSRKKPKTPRDESKSAPKQRPIPLPSFASNTTALTDDSSGDEMLKVDPVVQKTNNVPSENTPKPHRAVDETTHEVSSDSDIPPEKDPDTDVPVEQTDEHGASDNLEAETDNPVGARAEHTSDSVQPLDAPIVAAPIETAQIRSMLQTYLSTVDPRKVTLRKVYAMCSKELNFTPNKAQKATIKELVLETLAGSDATTCPNNLVRNKHVLDPRRKNPNLEMTDRSAPENNDCNVSDRPTDTLPPTIETTNASVIPTATITSNSVPIFGQCATESKGPTAAPSRKGTKPAQRHDRPKSRPSCTLCSTCTLCRRGSAKDDPVALDMTQSDASIEKALVRRLQKLEKLVERYMGQEDAIRRKLKAHRRDMWRKRERLMDMGKQAKRKSWFLPDSEELDAKLNQAECSKSMPVQSVQKARGKLLPTARAFQPTLTQIVRTDEPKVPAENDGEICPDQRETWSDDVAVGSAEVPVGMNVDADDEEDGFQSDSDDVLKTHYRLEVGTASSSTDNSMWTAVVSTVINSSFDSHFVDPADTENVGMSDLVDMIEHFKEPEPKSETNPTTIMMLDDQSRSLAREFKVLAEADMDAISSVFTRWEENLYFCLCQTSHESVTDARRELDKTHRQVLDARRIFSTVMEKRATAVCFFMKVLDAKLKHLEQRAHS